MRSIKSFTDYLNDSEREYHYRIKTAAPLEDIDLEFLERVLSKYVLKDITKPIKTILQKHPLDFPDIRNTEIWIVDVVTHLPASAYVLQQEIKLALKLPEKYVVVRSENDPLEIYTQEMEANAEIEAAAMEKGLKKAARLSTNRHYDEDERVELENPAYGNEYNKKFLETLAQVAADREKFKVTPDSEELNQGRDVSDPEVTEDDSIFNKHIDDAPKPQITNNYVDMLKNLRKEDKTSESRLSTKSNYDDDEIKQTKKYNRYGANEKVAVVTITNKKQGIRKT